MTLTTEDIAKLAQGQKIKVKAVRGNAAGTFHNMDMLAGACAIVCRNSPEYLTVSIAYTRLLDAKIHKKFGKPVSRNMIKARLDKLHDIGFLQKREEEIIREGQQPSMRHVYYMGDSKVAPLSSDEKALASSGKFTKKWWSRSWRSAYEMYKPKNRFEEAVFDLMSDTSITTFPTSMEDYRLACNHAFQEELNREDRVDQMISWVILAYIVDIDPTEARDNALKHIVMYAKKYSTPIWLFVQKQMVAFQKMAETGLKFNKSEYEKIVGKDPDFYKTVKEMRKEGKL
ncbi:hypothetical protein LCGC14_1119940 [marine sediment metagenome]|uniref:Uncharacterized protein n=1 Tax=marine sediment metagenome TaxID=412755 RepID=A0A0F9M924_9ZZZZ